MFLDDYQPAQSQPSDEQLTTTEVDDMLSENIGLKLEAVDIAIMLRNEKFQCQEDGVKFVWLLDRKP